MYPVHVDTVSKEEVAQIGIVRVEALWLHYRERLQHEESSVIKALGEEAQTQVHGIYEEKQIVFILSLKKNIYFLITKYREMP